MSKFTEKILTKTRAEEYDADIWGEFYIPPYFKELSLLRATKSSYIVGQRGCGKTMLLKYLDYHTAFSPKRLNISDNEVNHIGIYWRVDTQFCNSLNHRGLSEHDWTTIFESYFSLVIAVEIIRSLRQVAESTYQHFSMEDFEKLTLPKVRDFHEIYPISLHSLENELESSRRKFSTWISNISTVEKPLLPAGRAFLDSMIEDIRSYQGLECSSFYIYLDEVENLVSYQRHLLNSFIKHSQKPLIVSFTSKELSDDMATTGSESINATHDFNHISLDDLTNETEKKLFFSEVFLANLQLSSNNRESEFLNSLRSMNGFESRSGDEYRRSIISEIKQYFPTKTLNEFSIEAFNNPRIKKILAERIDKALGLKKSKLTHSEFYSSEFPAKLLLILPALISRKSNDAEELLSICKTHIEEPQNRVNNWIDNNLFGALLELYRPYGFICPLYSGFDTYFTMANNNLRHFLILCYKAREFAELSNQNLDKIPPEIQARAAYDAAEKLVNEVKTFGHFGERLRMFVLRLGNIFRALQAQPAMSEPEQNQFTINSGRALRSNEEEFLSEAEKYGILTEQLGNKTKSTLGRDVVDYQLNPIYAPYFQISYRRKRKIEISVEDLHVLALGTEDEYKVLFSQLVKNDMNAVAQENPQVDIWQ